MSRFFAENELGLWSIDASESFYQCMELEEWDLEEFGEEGPSYHDLREMGLV
jgi:hypothetical protein